jgi:hypothetical protein
MDSGCLGLNPYMEALRKRVKWHYGKVFQDRPHERGVRSVGHIFVERII